jgi:hypothetical protein
LYSVVIIRIIIKKYYYRQHCLDLIVYDINHQKFISDGIPATPDAWLDRARQVASIFAEDAAARDIENKSPRAEVTLPKSAGLLKVLGPKILEAVVSHGRLDTRLSGRLRRVTVVLECFWGVICCGLPLQMLSVLRSRRRGLRN